MTRAMLAAAILSGFVAGSCAGSSSSPNPSPPAPTPPPDTTPPPATPYVLVGAADIGWCNSTAPEATARLLDGIAGTVFVAGDVAYPHGTAQNFQDCYEPNWGRHKARTRPVPGNHDYANPAGAAPYFAYFGDNAGPRGLGYYSYDLGAWHIVALNSMLPVDAGSAQVAWLQRDLEESPLSCTLAYWHHPLVSSGTNGGSSFVRELWRVLYDYGAEIVLNGHEHRYERYAPMDPSERFDLTRGIRQFVVGTGGAPLYPLRTVQPHLETSQSTYGVLKLTLTPGNYAWEFIPTPGDPYRDLGSGTCH
jgi:3',5'-cyclic AMP phosphodiesterase CpdA